MLEETFRGLTRALSLTLPAVKGWVGMLTPNPETRRDRGASCFPSGRREQGPGQTPNNNHRREER